MEKPTNWLLLWEQLSLLQNLAFERQNKSKDNKKTDDFWKHKAKAFDKMVEKRWATPDSSRTFLVNLLKKNPGSTLLDIGAGTGKWSVLTAAHAKMVTAMEPSGAMQKILKQKIAQDQIQNIHIIDGNWPEDSNKLKPHDYVLASHSMYGVPDFKAFVTQMITHARKQCILVLRVPFCSAPMAKAAQRVLGQPHDSPNFQVAYNALMDMDIYPDVIMEEENSWQPWCHDSLELALEDLKNRLNIIDNPSHDRSLKQLLENSLIPKKDKWEWPTGNRSALIHWEVL